MTGSRGDHTAITTCQLCDAAGGADIFFGMVEAAEAASGKDEFLVGCSQEHFDTLRLKALKQ